MKAVAKKFFLGICLILLLAIMASYSWYMSLKEYTWKDNMVIGENIKYVDAGEKGTKYTKDDFKAGKTIGRFKGDKFLGSKTWVIKLKGVDANKAVLIKGIMFESIYIAQ